MKTEQPNLMPEILLRTKLFIPSARPNQVLRPRLVELLDVGVQSGYKLTLVSAPAGFGKTTLVSEWVQQLQAEATNDIAWLSLDENDNELNRFLEYLVTAVNQASDKNIPVGKNALTLLQSTHGAPDSILISLINDVVRCKRSIVLILDDYHLIDAPPVDRAVTFLLDHSPPQLNIVVVTRADPQLPLGRLRANGDLNELRAADLRFTSAEVAAFFNQVMALNLSTADIDLLENRTEGWIAGLQLAALALQGSIATPEMPDAARMIQSFTGSHRFVLDYLLEEVLEQQPEEVQRFLLQTAVLNRLTGPLCDALTNMPNSQTTLEMLERANLFIVPLDEERQWYRYHHLFAELLRQRLHAKLTTAAHPPAAELHIRASRWYEQNQLLDEAIAHALQGGDFARAAALIDQVAEAMWLSGKDAKLRGWLAQLPQDALLTRPQLGIFWALQLVAQGEHAAAGEILDQTETALPNRTNRAVNGRIASCRAFLAFYSGDLPNIVTYARRALATLPAEELAWRSIATHILGDAYDLSGEMHAAYQARLEGVTAARAAGEPMQIMLAHLKLAIILRHQGKLQQVVAICDQQYQFADSKKLQHALVAGWLLAIWAEALAEMNALDDALAKLDQSLTIAAHGGDIAMRSWIYLCGIRIRFSRAEFAAAEALVQTLDAWANEHFVPGWMLDLNAAWQVRLWLAGGNLLEAQQWVTARQLDAAREPAYAQEAAFLALARVWLAQGRAAEAAVLLAQMAEPAQANGRIARAVEMRILQALAYAGEAQDDQALAALENALALAQRGDFVRIFVDEGAPMARLLYAALEKGTAVSTVRQLLAAFPAAGPETAVPANAETYDWVEPLSPREVEVLQQIADGFTNQEIGVQLSLTLNTIKAHTRNIYSKLAVNNRMQAVARARELGILSPN